ncbi:linear amide C-N hydrolase [Ruegeria atlantica]|uniref:linear amide C-N hydrolase n=1 Tax=Ruegeria atlantica TaxID=81569 RepID=UPI002494BCA5|nr:linear amide C-N hydrolase [Ruegeria atlantica]
MIAISKLTALAAIGATIVTTTVTPALACSRILWAPEGEPVLVGRNEDWFESLETKVYAFPKGIERNGAVGENPVTWTSKYGSVSAIVYGIAVTDGMNEAGLNSSLLYLAESEFGERDTSKSGISVSVFSQWMLDNFATVDEVVAALDSIQLVPITMMHDTDEVQAPFHYSVADASGNSAIIEVLGGEFVIHKGPEFKVMTNSPTYDEQMEQAKQYVGLGGDKPLPGSSQSPDRYARGAYYLSLLPDNPATYQEAVANVLSVIRNMSTPWGVSDPGKPNVAPTLWRTVSDLTNGRYYFEFTQNPTVAWIDLHNLDLSEGAPITMFDLKSDILATGEVSNRFNPAKKVDWLPGGAVLNPGS